MANLSVLQHFSELEQVRTCIAQVRISVWDSQTVTEPHRITAWFGLEGTIEDCSVQSPQLLLVFLR